MRDKPASAQASPERLPMIPPTSSAPEVVIVRRGGGRATLSATDALRDDGRPLRADDAAAGLRSLETLTVATVQADALRSRPRCGSGEGGRGGAMTMPPATRSGIGRRAATGARRGGRVLSPGHAPQKTPVAFSVYSRVGFRTGVGHAGAVAIAARRRDQTPRSRAASGAEIEAPGGIPNHPASAATKPHGFPSFASPRNSPAFFVSKTFPGSMKTASRTAGERVAEIASVFPGDTGSGRARR
jgi:hypothetical protein